MKPIVLLTILFLANFHSFAQINNLPDKPRIIVTTTDKENGDNNGNMISVNDMQRELADRVASAIRR